ncbi:MAG: HAMP domain-containing protein [Bdellovibrionales bacterium]|nr:HAMP domain-containing protein [Bdellovibrionales bacterium]
MKVRLSIRTKLVGMINAVLLGAAGAIVISSTDLFSKDNIARIQEANLESARLLAQEVQNDVKNLTEKLRLVGVTMMQPLPAAQMESLQKPFFENDKEFISASVLTQTEAKVVTQVANAANDAVIKALDLTRDEINQIQDKVDPALAFSPKETIQSFDIKGKIPLLLVTLPLIQDDKGAITHAVVATVKQDRFLKAVSNDSFILSYLVDSTGSLLAHPDQSRVLKKENLSNLEIVKQLLSGKSNNGQTRFTDPDTQKVLLGAFKTVGFGGIGVVSQVEEAKALEAANRVRKISILVTGIVGVVAFALIYFFSLSLTTPLVRLVDATAKISRGEYDVTLKKGANDEIGDLTVSFNEMATGLAEREKIKNAFSKFHSKDVADKILSGELNLVGERKRVTIFFSDIRSFTTLSEKLQPEQVVELVNAYMTRMVRIIFAHGGVVDKYVGDAIMAVYGTPVVYGNDSLRAVAAAIRMRAEMVRFNADQMSKGKPAIAIGMGMNTGDVVAGNIGSPERMEYTILGDAVNLTSRMESLTKEFKTDILISGETYNEIKEHIHCMPRGSTKVKGKNEEVAVYEVIGFRPGYEFIPPETGTTGETGFVNRNAPTPPPLPAIALQPAAAKKEERKVSKKEEKKSAPKAAPAAAAEPAAMEVAELVVPSFASTATEQPASFSPTAGGETEELAVPSFDHLPAAAPVAFNSKSSIQVERITDMPAAKPVAASAPVQATAQAPVQKAAPAPAPVQAAPVLATYTPADLELAIPSATLSSLGATPAPAPVPRGAAPGPVNHELPTANDIVAEVDTSIMVKQLTEALKDERNIAPITDDPVADVVAIGAKQAGGQKKAAPQTRQNAVDALFAQAGGTPAPVAAVESSEPVQINVTLEDAA